ncbi:DNA topoisomerase 2 [Hordeum vulgare]|nr:DNA topoisomerase 2 [Hordeum vulgare]
MGAESLRAYVASVAVSVLCVIPSMVVRSLKEFVSIPRTGSLTLEITLDSEDDDISVSIPCSYFTGLGGRMVLKKEGFDGVLVPPSSQCSTPAGSEQRRLDGVMDVEERSSPLPSIKATPLASVQ